MRAPMPWLSRFGNCLSAAWMAMYNSLQLCNKEKFWLVPKISSVPKNWLGGGLNSHVLFDGIISPENVFSAWREFQKDKRNRPDVQEFETNAEESIFALCEDLKSGRYHHGPYKAFWVCDPKRRLIHKACVRDRLLHHAIFRVLYPIFNKHWIYDSFSSRESKGTHAALKRFRDFTWKVSRNNTRDVWVLKADVKKYFDSIDHEILKKLLIRSLSYGGKLSAGILGIALSNGAFPNEDRSLKNDNRLLDLLRDNIQSYSTLSGKGIPLGNLTSQLFANIYLNPFDQYVKRRLSVSYYLRYADDTVIVSDSREFLVDLLPCLRSFLADELQLTVHPNKVSISRWDKGIDVLGFISYPTKTIMRASTERRMMKMLERQLETANFDIQLNALYSRVRFERL